MIISEEIRIIPELTGQTSTTEESELKLINGYLVYTSSFGGNVVDEFTVRDFLDNPIYEQLATIFFNYLKSNFSNTEFNEIYYSNLKLSEVFNDYYDKTIRNNVPANKQVANSQLADKILVSYNSYYIKFQIFKSINILENQNYDKYKKDSLGNVITKNITEKFRYFSKNKSIDFITKKTKTSQQRLIQSFVDLNFNDNESEFWN